MAATLWCPYICDDPAREGLTVEFIRQLLAQKNIDLKVTILPWSRAIRLAEQGHFDGLLTAVESEVPDLHLTSQPSGYYQMCLFSKKGRNLKYVDRSSLQSRVLGGVKDYGYGVPIDDVINHPKQGENVYLISGNEPLNLLIGMTNLSRIDFFPEDPLVLNDFIKDKPHLQVVKQAGCLEKIPFYTAIAPNHPQKEKWLSLLDSLLIAPGSSALYSQLKQKYLLEN